MAYRNARSVPAARRRSPGASLRSVSTGRSDEYLYRCMRGDRADLRAPTHGSQRIIGILHELGMILRWNFA